MTASPQECAQVNGGNGTFVVLVDAAVGCQRSEVVSAFQVAAQLFQQSLQGQFLLDDLQQGALNITGQIIIATHTTSVSFDCSASEEIIFTRQKHLREICEGKLPVIV